MERKWEVALTILGVSLFSLALSVSFNFMQSSTINNLNSQETIYQNSIVKENSTITSLVTEVTSIQEHPTTVTATLTQIEISTSNVTVYPLPSNVTLAFSQVSGSFTYTVTLNGTQITGSNDVAMAIPLTNLFQGETVGVQVNVQGGLGGCAGGQTVTAQLYLNGTLLNKSSTLCGGAGIAFSAVV